VTSADAQYAAEAGSFRGIDEWSFFPTCSCIQVGHQMFGSGARQDKRLLSSI